MGWPKGHSLEGANQMKHKSREDWLRAMADLIYKNILTLKVIRSLPMQMIKGNALEGGSMTRVPLSKVQISCAYSPNMRVGQVVKSGTVDAKVRAIGQCFYARTVKDDDGNVIADFDTNIFITPRENDPVVVTEILIHELMHPITKGHGHKGSFKTLGKAIGLHLTPGGNGHTSANPALVKQIKGLAKKLGKYPHKKWVPSAQYKKQTTRMFKMTSLGVMCEPAEGFKNSWVATPFTCRVSRLAMSAGFPMDPDGKSMFLEVTKDELEQLCLHPVTPDEYKNHTMKLPSGGRGISEDAYKLTQMVGVDLIKSSVADNVLTRDENAVMFEIACMANSSCGMWASELVNDNHSWFTNKEIKDMMPWNEAYTMQVLRSLKEKDVIAYDMIDMGDEGPKHHGFVNVYLSDSDDGKVEKSSAYKVMKSYDGLDPHRANPFMIESGASSPCPPSPTDETHKRFCPEFVSRSSDYSPEANRELNARAIEDLERERKVGQEQIARQTENSQDHLTKQTLRMMTHLSDHIFMIEKRIEDLEIEVESLNNEAVRRI